MSDQEHNPEQAYRTLSDAATADRLALCVTCGAVVSKTTVEMHNAWHDRLNSRVDAADSGVGFLSGLGLGSPGRL